MNQNGRRCRRPIQSIGTPRFVPKFAYAAFHTFVEVGEGELGARLVTGLCDRPSQAALIRHTTDQELVLPDRFMAISPNRLRRCARRHGLALIASPERNGCSIDCMGGACRVARRLTEGYLGEDGVYAGLGHDLSAINMQPKRRSALESLRSSVMAHAARRQEGEFTAHGAFLAVTGERTGRSANDKWTVQEPTTQDLIWWDGTVNRPFDNERFELLRDRAIAFLAEQDELFVQDLICGAERSEAIQCRVVTMNAWHAAFARNMFVRPSAERTQASPCRVDRGPRTAPRDRRLERARPQQPSRSACSTQGAKLVVICGTRYAGEIKKSIFTAMNLMLPGKGILPMHCSANTTGSNTAVFFGLSGTGKTTLSADPNVRLVGDDEHGWGAKGSSILRAVATPR